MQLRDTRLEDFDRHDLSMRRLSPRSDSFRAAVEASSIRFSMQHGRVEAVCADSDDDVWVVNFKRGIVSAFQNTMTSLTSEATVLEVRDDAQLLHQQLFICLLFQTDVSGTCDTDYDVIMDDELSVTVSKTKRLSTCLNRDDLFSSVRALSASLPTVRKSGVTVNTHNSPPIHVRIFLRFRTFSRCFRLIRRTPASRRSVTGSSSEATAARRTS